MKNEVFILLILIAAIFLAYLVFAKGDRKKITLINSDRSISLEVEFANSSATRMKGLMGRSSLAENDGMLFIFDHPDRYGFWMLNTTIHLEAIHFGKNGTVVDIINMEPCGLNVTQCKLYPPKEPSMYVLEVNSGFSKKNNLSIGKTKLNLEDVR